MEDIVKKIFKGLMAENFSKLMKDPNKENHNFRVQNRIST